VTSDNLAEHVAERAARDAANAAYASLNGTCDEWCPKQAAAQLLGPLRPNVCVCAHGVRRTLDDVFPAHRAEVDPT
jgi:hypothetical protein